MKKYNINDINKLRCLQSMTVKDFNNLFDNAKKISKSNDHDTILNVMFKINDKKQKSL